MEDLGEPCVLTEVRDRVGWITLNRPAVINAINNSIRTGLPQALSAFDRDPDVRVIVLRGAGDRGFCVGADIKEFRPEISLVQSRDAMIQGAWIEAVGRASKPVIAAIHGFCLGAGLELALACDIRIASPDASFGLPEVDLGLIPGGGGTQNLPRLIGMARALDLMLTGDRIDAGEAHRLGLISRVCASAASLFEETAELSARIAAKPPVALAYVKEAVRLGLEADLQTGLRLEKTLFALLQSTDDRWEAATAFREKRPPRFAGR